MIYDFTYYNPTKIYFGKKSLENLEAELKNYGKNVLLVYGKVHVPAHPCGTCQKLAHLQ